MSEPPGMKHKGLMNKEDATVIITTKVEEIIATMPPGGSSGNIDGGAPDSVYGGQTLIVGEEI